jgi:hypothetical protein
MTMTLSGDGTITGLVAGGLPDATVTADDLAAGAALNNAPNSVGFRNRIINGDMRIDQRNAGAAVTVTDSLPVDRFRITNSTDGAFSAQQDSSAPAGFVTSLKVTTTTADATLTTTQALLFTQNIEGVNVADLNWGSGSAKTVTLSFWVRSSLTGTFGGSVRNSALNRSYPFTYSISAADTWEQKSVTIAGDTTGTWLTDSGTGIRISFGLGVGPDRSGTAGAWAGANYSSATGAVSVIGTLNATWYITGVQLEVGSVATPFERRPYGTELALCQRYCNVYGENTFSVFGSMGYAFSTTGFLSATHLPVEMRAAPTLSVSGNTRCNPDNVSITSATFNTTNSSKKIAVVEPAVASGLTSNRGYYWTANNDATARVIFSAEL